MTCTDCQHAASCWNWQTYRAECPDCQIRVIAQAPKTIREIRYEQIRRAAGSDACDAIKERVRTEHARIKALKGTS